MGHNHLTGVEAETVKASGLLIGTLLGGMFVVVSFVVEMPSVARTLFQYDAANSATGANPYSDIIALVGAVMLGAPLVWHALQCLIHGHTHMDELVALAVVAAIALGEYQEAGIIAFFMIISSLIETRTALGARASIESLLRLTPETAQRMRPDGTEESVEAKNLAPGDAIRIRPGDNIPADGEVIKGESTVNEANITGESLPLDKKAGDEVFSGTNNLTGALDVRVTKAGSDTTLGRVQGLILEAEKTRIPLMRLIDKYAGWYTPTICMLAGVAFVVVERPSLAIDIDTPTDIEAALANAGTLGARTRALLETLA